MSVIEIKEITEQLPGPQTKAWYIDFSQCARESIQICAYHSLSKSEFSQGLTMASESQTMQHWCSRLALRRALSLYTNFVCQPQSWEIQKLPSGKLVVDHPVANRMNLDFSLTHTKGIVVCALSKGRPIGIDAEPKDRKIGSAVINNRRVFSAHEKKSLTAAAGLSRYQMALKLWTLKEACSKALGLGAAIDFSSLQFRVSGSGDCQLESVQSRPAREWSTQVQHLNDDYLFAVAAGRRYQ